MCGATASGLHRKTGRITEMTASVQRLQRQTNRHHPIIANTRLCLAMKYTRALRSLMVLNAAILLCCVAGAQVSSTSHNNTNDEYTLKLNADIRSEERRVGKE